MTFSTCPRSSDLDTVLRVLDKSCFWLANCSNRVKSLDIQMFTVVDGRLRRPCEIWLTMASRAIELDDLFASERFGWFLRVFTETAHAFPDDKVLEDDLAVFQAMLVEF